MRLAHQNLSSDFFDARSTLLEAGAGTGLPLYYSISGRLALHNGAIQWLLP
jgi:hypothetical protein